MTQIATNPGADIRPVARTSRVRPWIALAAAAVLFACGLLGVLPFILVLPVIGVVLALGSPPDNVTHARSIARRPRNAVLGVVLVAALAVVILQPQLSVPLVTLFGLDGSGLAVTCLGGRRAGPALGDDGCTNRQTADRLVPADPAEPDPVPHRPGYRGRLVRRARPEPPPDRRSGAHFAADHRVKPPSLRPAPTARIRPPTPTPPRRTRTAPAAAGQRDSALRPTGPHPATGAYDPIALQLTPGLHRVLLTAFWVGLAAFVLLSLIPLRRVRLGSNLLVAAATIFLAVQLISVYRPPVDAVTVGTPLAGEWWVGHGGHAELVNYHQTRSTQRDALDIMQVVNGSIHRPGRTDLTSYYIYDQPVLAPADGTVTYVVDGHPDLPIGLVDSQHPTGNQLVIDIGGGHYLLMGHLRQGSIIVNVGERVTEGQQIARVGKSGHSSHPHIHIQAQTLPTGIADLTTIDGPKMLKTLHTYPLLFRRASLIRGGVETRPTAVDPRRGDFVRPTR